MSTALLLIGVFGGLAAFLVRFRRSAGTQREQLKWLAYALGLFWFLSILTALLPWLWRTLSVEGRGRWCAEWLVPE